MALRAVCQCGWRGEPGEEARRHEIGHWVAESCAAQGVPLHVTDPVVLRRIAVLLGVHKH